MEEFVLCRFAGDQRGRRGRLGLPVFRLPRPRARLVHRPTPLESHCREIAVVRARLKQLGVVDSPCARRRVCRAVQACGLRLQQSL
eukprot:15480014-Alexandrium_andersonii.AAC.1